MSNSVEISKVTDMFQNLNVRDLELVLNIGQVILRDKKSTSRTAKVDNSPSPSGKGKKKRKTTPKAGKKETKSQDKSKYDSEPLFHLHKRFQHISRKYVRTLPKEDREATIRAEFEEGKKLVTKRNSRFKIEIFNPQKLAEYLSDKNFDREAEDYDKIFLNFNIEDVFPNFITARNTVTSAWIWRKSSLKPKPNKIETKTQVP
jgi:hypothetical protein